MANTPWEPCPRCSSPSVEVTEKGNGVAGTFAVLFIVAAIIFFVVKFMDWFGDGALIAGIILIPLGALLFGWIVVPILMAGAAVVGGVASAGIKGYKAKCQVCAYEWEIAHNAPINPQDNQYVPPYNFPQPPGKR